MSWGLPKLGFGSGSEPPSPTPSEISSKSAPAQAFPTFSAARSLTPSRGGTATPPGPLSSVPESKPLDLHSLMSQAGPSGTPPTPKDPRGMMVVSGNAAAAPMQAAILDSKAKDDTDRLLRWDQQCQQVDKEQSEVMHQHWRLFREQVATLSGEAVGMRSELRELYRVTDQEVNERKVAVDGMTAALRTIEERIFAVLEELRRQQIAQEQALDNEKAERKEADTKLGEELEAEKLARIGADAELAEEIAKLRNSTEEGFQQSSGFMKEQSSIIETRMRETEAGLQQLLRNLEGQLGEEAKARAAGDVLLERALEEKFVQLRTVLTEFAGKSDVGALKNELERETTERIRGDKELDDKFMNLRPILAEGATKSELQAIKNGLEQEMAERTRGDDNSLDLLRQGLERELREREELSRNTQALLQNLSTEFTTLLDNRVNTAEALTQQVGNDLRSQLEAEMQARAAGEQELDEKFLQLRPVLAASQADLNALRTELERLAADLDREALARAEGDRDTLKQQLVETALLEINKDFNDKIEQEVKNRTAGDEQILQTLNDGFDGASKQRSDIIRMVESTEAKMMQTFQTSLEDEGRVRAENDQRLMRDLQESVERGNLERTEIVRMVEATEMKIVQTYNTLLEEEVNLRTAGDQNLARDVEDKFAQLRPLLVDFAGKSDVSNLREELEERFVQLRPILAEAASKVDFTALRGELERLAPALQAEFEDKFSSLRPIFAEIETTSKNDMSMLREALEKEAKERILGDENLANVMSQESGERQKAHGDITRSLEESHTLISRSLDSHVTGYSQEEAMKNARFDELKSALGMLSETMSEEFALLRGQLQKEELSRVEGDALMEKRLFESHTEHTDKHASVLDNHGRFSESLELKLMELANVVERNQATLKADLDLAQQDKQAADTLLKQVLQDMESTATQRMRELLLRLEAEAETRTKELESLMATHSQFEQQVVERIKMMLEGLADEAQERRVEDEKLQAGLHGVPVEVFTQQLKDLWASLESEAAQRKAGDEALDSTVRTGFDTVGQRHLEQGEEWRRSIAAHREELEKASSALHGKLEEDRGLQTRALQELVTQVDFHKDVHREHSGKHDETLQQMQALVETLERERAAREQDSAAMRSAYEGALMELERSLHEHKTGSQTASGQMAEIVKALHEKLEVGIQEHARAVSEVHDRLAGQAKEHSDRHEDVSRRTQAAEAEFLRRMQDIEQQFEKTLEKRFKDYTEKHEALDNKLTLELKRTSDTHTVRLNDMKDMLGGHKDKIAEISKELYQKLNGHQSENKDKLAALLRDIDDKFQGLQRLYSENLSSVTREMNSQVQDLIQSERRAREKGHGELLEHVQGHGAGMSELERQLRMDSEKLEQQLRDDLQRGLDGHAQAHLELQDKFHETHADTKQTLQVNLHEVVSNTNLTLQKELEELKDGHVQGTEGLKEHLATVVKQVETLSDGLEAEEKLRKDMQESFQKEYSELRRDLEAKCYQQIEKLQLHEQFMVKLEQEIRGDLEHTAEQFGSMHQNLMGDLEMQRAESQRIAEQTTTMITETRSISKQIEFPMGGSPETYAGNQYAVGPSNQVAAGNQYVGGPANQVAAGNQYAVGPANQVAAGNQYVGGPTNQVAAGNQYAATSQPGQGSPSLTHGPGSAANQPTAASEAANQSPASNQPAATSQPSSPGFARSILSGLGWGGSTPNQPAAANQPTTADQPAAADQAGSASQGWFSFSGSGTPGRGGAGQGPGPAANQTAAANQPGSGGVGQGPGPSANQPGNGNPGQGPGSIGSGGAGQGPGPSANQPAAANQPGSASQGFVSSGQGTPGRGGAGQEAGPYANQPAGANQPGSTQGFLPSGQGTPGLGGAGQGPGFYANQSAAGSAQGFLSSGQGTPGTPGSGGAGQGPGPYANQPAGANQPGSTQGFLSSGQGTPGHGGLGQGTAPYANQPAAANQQGSAQGLLSSGQGMPGRGLGQGPAPYAQGSPGGSDVQGVYSPAAVASQQGSPVSPRGPGSRGQGAANQQGGSSPGSVRDIMAGMNKRLESLTDAMQEEQSLRSALAEQVQRNTDLLADTVKQGQSDVTESLAQMRADLDAMNAEHTDKHSDHHTAFASIHEKLQNDLNELNSGVQSDHSSLKSIVVEVTKQVDTLTTSIEDMEKTLQTSCTNLRTDVNQALEEAHAGLKQDLASLNGKKDELYKAVGEVNSALQKDVGEHKERTEKERLALRKDIQEHKARAEEERRARDAAHSKISAELQSRERAHVGLDGKVEDVEKRLKAALDALSAKHQTLTESMSATERKLSQELAKQTQGSAARQNEIERKLREELAALHAKLRKDISEVSTATDGKHAGLKETVTKVTREVDALAISVQEEMRLRTMLEEKLSKKCDGLRIEVTELHKESAATLRKELTKEFADLGMKKNKELEAAMQSANEALKKEIRDHKANVQTEHDSMRGQIRRQASIGSPNRGESSPGLVRETEVRTILHGDMENMTSRLQDQQSSLRNDMAEVERRLRKEIGALCDELVAKQQEGLREMLDELDGVNKEHHRQHQDTRLMITEHIRSVLQDADGKVRRTIDDLRREVEDHRENLKNHLMSQRGLDEQGLLTSAVQRLEDEMERVHTLSGEVSQLKFDQDLAQGNLDRRLQELDILVGSVGQLTADHDDLRRTVTENSFDKGHPDGWEEEVRRIWEAIDSHTHDVAVEDFEEQTPGPVKSVVRHEFIRQVANTQRIVAPNPMSPTAGVRRIGAVPATMQLPSSPVMAPAAVPRTMPLMASEVRPSPMSPRSLSPPTMSPVGTISAPIGTSMGTVTLPMGQQTLGSTLGNSSQLSGSHKLLPFAHGGSARFEPTSPSLPVTTFAERSVPSTATLVGTEIRRAAVTEAVPLVSSQNLTQNLTKTDVSATVGKARHDVRPADRITETITHGTPKIHHHIEAHVGKALFEHKSDLDPEKASSFQS